MVTAARILAVHYSDNERLFPQSSGDAAWTVNACSPRMRDRLVAVHNLPVFIAEA